MRQHEVLRSLVIVCLTAAGGSGCSDSTVTILAPCGGCLIAGICVFDDQRHPVNPCLSCDVTRSTTAWSDNDGAACDDGLDCTGVETCAHDQCVSTGNPCASTDVCWEDADGQCCSAGGILACNVAQDVVELDSCGRTLRLVRPCGSYGATCDQGRCACDPVSGVGCPPDEKCTFVGGETGCEADGDKLFGQACTADLEGSDDCAAGGDCHEGICAEFCTYAPDSCGDGFLCSYELTVDETTLGVCVARCDPVVQDCLRSSEACYLADNGDAYCVVVPAESRGLTQGHLCYGAVASGACYFNGCDEGYGALLGDDTCTFFCNPIDNWLGNLQGLAGDPAGITCDELFGGARPDGPGSTYECRYIQSYFSGTEGVPAAFGMCVDLANEGTCADFDWVELQADLDAGVALDGSYCDANPERCMFSCISQATLAAAF
jgi:hypothetical protein